ncbi:MAG: SH3 domain-containing protein [Dongiaceae bacterium]
MRPDISPAVLGRCILIIWLAITYPVATAHAQTIGSETSLPVPRFVSLRSSEVNLRTGPGTNYPVDWVFVRRGLPVEVIAEFDVWRKIRDWQGTVGWVHQSMLAGRRTALISGLERTLGRTVAADAAAVARLAPGVIAEIGECVVDWCRLEVDGLSGWLRRDEFWGVYPEERIE